MLRLSISYEGATLRNDGNPLYVNALLKRTQFFCDKIQGRTQNDKLLRYFNDPTNPQDPQAMRLAERCIKDFGRLEIEHLRPDGNLKPWGDFDYHLWVDWGEDALTEILGYAPKIPEKNLVYWASDTHLGYDHRRDMCKRAKIAFVAQKKAKEDMEKEGIKTEWLPHAVEPLAYNKGLSVTKKHDICFVGHVNSENRKMMLDRAFRDFPDFFYGQRRFNDAARVYFESRVCLNIAMKEDVNMRCFEILGSGGFMVTDKIYSIDELFEDKKHLVLWENLDDMSDKISYYLKNPEERKAISEEGYNHVMKNHTFENRINKILDAIQSDNK